MSQATLKSILYVEDDADIQAVAQIALEVVGCFSLKICGSGQAAVALIAGGYTPDLLLLDVMMPDMDGPSTLTAIRQLKQTAAIPAIFMTAKVQTSEVTHYKSLGAIGVIAKPFDPMHLSEQVRQLWEQGHARQ